ncbi:MAG: DoxX family protein [Rikenellaceae bacterium]
MEDNQNRVTSNDWTILYLRIVTGGALLLHNVAKMQNYNYIIDSYRELWGMGGATWYVAFSFIEVICAFLLIMGRWVRSAAAVLILGTLAGMIIYFGSNSSLMIELNALYILIYILFLIGGGGNYSIDANYKYRDYRAKREAKKGDRN